MSDWFEGFRSSVRRRGRAKGARGLERSPVVRSIMALGIVVAFLAAGAGSMVTADGDDDEDAPRFGDWSPPMNLGPVVNSDVSDLGSAISRDGRSLFFSRPGGALPSDVWVSQRSSRHAPWGPPVSIGPTVNTAANEGIPALSRDDHWMFMNSNRLGSFGLDDLWVSYRENIHDDFGWQTPVNLGPGVNSAFADQGAGYFEHGECKDDDDDDDDVEREGGRRGTRGGRDNDDDDDEEECAAFLYFNSNRPGGIGLLDIYVSERMPNGSFGAAELVEELSSPTRDQRPNVRFDGLELFLWSDRPGSLGLDIWVSTRDAVTDPWTPPVNLGPIVNSPLLEAQAYISSDGKTLYFSSTRPGGLGGYDLYVTTRTVLHNGEDDDDEDDGEDD